MKLGIIGYGKMGKTIERLAVQYGFSNLIIIDNEEDWIKKQDEIKTCDVAIEFSTPQTVIENLTKCFENQIPVVSGTTGWQDKKEASLQLWQNKPVSFIYGSNFSIGVNLFFKLNEWLAQLMKSHPQYSVSIKETHHIHKKDIPSGTALTIQQGIQHHFDNSLVIPITSKREGEVIGEHFVSYESVEDIIEIKHNALNRESFADGALKAARWLIEHPGVYIFEDIFESV
jgi:4-hydroxy-tetrahydrodipicolinate reductase